MFKKLLLSFAALLVFVAPSYAKTDDHQDKVNLCHLTDSETNPFVVQSVDANEVQSHEANGDFLYQGTAGIHTQEAKDWCKNNQPGDLCVNIDGKQTEVPQGDVVKDGQCTPKPPVECPTGQHLNVDQVCVNDPTPPETPPTVLGATTLPDTGGGLEFLLLGLGTTGLGAVLKYTLRKG